jgi:hypothetical protein
MVIAVPASNVKSERLSQWSKHLSEILRTDAGMQIERSNEQCRNTELSRFAILQPDSNVTSRSFAQELKHQGEIVETDEGMQID